MPRLLQHMSMDFILFFCTCLAPIFLHVLHYDAKSYLGVSSCLVMVSYHHSLMPSILLLEKWNLRRMTNPESLAGFYFQLVEDHEQLDSKRCIVC